MFSDIFCTVCNERSLGKSETHHLLIQLQFAEIRSVTSEYTLSVVHYQI